jgi:hypothetical protein
MSHGARIACLEMDLEATLEAKHYAKGLRRLLFTLQALQLTLDIYRVQRDAARTLRNV